MTVHTKKITKRVCLVLGVCLALASACILPEIYARYFTKDKIEDGAQVAPFVLDSNFEMQSVNLELSNKVKNAGDTASFEFEVKNHAGGAVTAVDLQYTVTVESYGTLPLEFIIQRTDVDAISSGGGKVYYTQSMEASVESTHRYTVTVRWPEGVKDADFADEIDVVTVTVTCNQQD